MNSGLFVDWITISQSHPSGGLKVINDGCVMSIDSNGESDWIIDKAYNLEGSHSSRVLISCDGFTVKLSGNVGRFNRTDNLFGYTFERVIQLANDLLARLELPPFTPGHSQLLQGTHGLQFTGATVTRLDLTKNYITGSQTNACSFLDHLTQKSVSRMKTGVFPDGGTVDFGRGSKFIYHKVYNKFLQVNSSKQKSKPTLDVMEWIRVNGVIRHEVTLKSRFLTQNNLRFLGAITMDRLNNVYELRACVITEEKIQVESYNELPSPFAATAFAWREGMDMRKLSRATYYRHRKALLRYGIDISMPCNVRALPIRVREITIQAATAPDWYWIKSA